MYCISAPISLAVSRLFALCVLLHRRRAMARRKRPRGFICTLTTQSKAAAATPQQHDDSAMLSDEHHSQEAHHHEMESQDHTVAPRISLEEERVAHEAALRTLTTREKTLKATADRAR